MSTATRVPAPSRTADPSEPTVTPSRDRSRPIHATGWYDPDGAGWEPASERVTFAPIAPPERRPASEGSRRT
jgi:hypothetical protein